jgi:pimeloyl-ACP methyl ester carboxylesterase
MTSDQPVVWLPPAQPVARDGIVAALTRVGPVLTPELTPPAGAVILEGPALEVLAAISGHGADRAVLCGWGLGTMVALQVAAGFPDRVSALLLMTHHRYETRALLSVSEGVLGLLPAGTLQRLGVRPRRIVELLDRVRPVDFRLLAPLVSVPALVLVGDRDRANRGPSAALAKMLPMGRLRVVPGAAADWQNERPDQLAELLARLLRG